LRRSSRPLEGKDGAYGINGRQGGFCHHPKKGRTG